MKVLPNGRRDGPGAAPGKTLKRFQRGEWQPATLPAAGSCPAALGMSGIGTTSSLGNGAEPHPVDLCCIRRLSSGVTLRSCGGRAAAWTRARRTRGKWSSATVRTGSCASGTPSAALCSRGRLRCTASSGTWRRRDSTGRPGFWASTRRAGRSSRSCRASRSGRTPRRCCWPRPASSGPCRSSSGLHSTGGCGVELAPDPRTAGRAQRHQAGERGVLRRPPVRLHRLGAGRSLTSPQRRGVGGDQLRPLAPGSLLPHGGLCGATGPPRPAEAVL